jgi:NADH dehydrogenase ubiquinone Fe-S protein 4
MPDVIARTKELPTGEITGESPTPLLGEEPVIRMVSTFPPDAVAVIYRPSRSAMTSGSANSRKWKLRFEHRSPPVIEPLMGWTGGEDPLAQVEMTFPSAQAAIAYARHQGLEFALRDPNEADMASHHRVLTSKPDDRGRRVGGLPRREFVERPVEEANGRRMASHGQAGVATGYANPGEVLRDPKLAVEQKRNLLRQWAFDAYCMEVAATDRVPASVPSRLDEAIDALIDLRSNNRDCRV